MEPSKTPGESFYRKTQNGFIFETDHEQALNDCAFDYYSRRIATCANDSVVKIYDTSVAEKPVMVAQLNDHTASVWRVSWSHPRYGNLLATCSYDKSVFIYKETSLYKFEIIYMNLEHKSSVNCIEWSPHEFGLHLACASSDGYISVISYLPFKELTSEGYWHRCSFKTHPNGVSCLCWEKSNNLTVSSKSLNLNETSEVKNSLKIVTGGFDNQVIIWTFDTSSKELHKTYQMNDKPHNAAIRDVTWKPSVNNANNVILSCAEDNTLIIWVEDLSNNRWKNSQTIKFDCKVYKIQWSSNGCLFAVAGENDNVFLFKENAEGMWEEICKLNERDIKNEKHDEDLKAVGQYYASFPNVNTSSTQQTNQTNSSMSRNFNTNMNYAPSSQNTTGMPQPTTQGTSSHQNNCQMNLNTQGEGSVNKTAAPMQMNLSQTTTTIPTSTQTNAFTNNQNASFASPSYGMNFNQNRTTGLLPSGVNSYQPQTTTTRPSTSNNTQHPVGYLQNNSISNNTYQNTTTTTTNAGNTRMDVDKSIPSQNPMETKMNSTTSVNNSNTSYNNNNNYNYSSRIQMNPPIPASTSSVVSSNMNSMSNINNAVNKQPSFAAYSTTTTTAFPTTNNNPTTTTTTVPTTTTTNVPTTTTTAFPTTTNPTTTTTNPTTTTTAFPTTTNPTTTTTTYNTRSFHDTASGAGNTTDSNQMNSIPASTTTTTTNAFTSTYTNSQMGQQVHSGMYMNTNQQNAYANMPKPPMPPPSQK